MFERLCLVFGLLISRTLSDSHVNCSVKIKSGVFIELEPET